MESNGHEEPFKDKSNTVDALPSPQPSPLPDLPPRRQSLVGLKGIMASRKSWWENQLTSSVGQSDGHPLSHSMPCLNICESRSTTRSSVSPRKLAAKFGRQFSDQQENYEVSSKHVTDIQLQKQVLQDTDMNSSKDQSYDEPELSKLDGKAVVPVRAVEEVEQPAAADERPEEAATMMDEAVNAAETVENQSIEQPVEDQTIPVSPAKQASVPVSPAKQASVPASPAKQASVPVSPAKQVSPVPVNDLGENSRSVTPDPKQTDQPYWKRFTNVWKRTPLSEKKPQVDRAPVEASLCAASPPTAASTKLPIDEKSPQHNLGCQEKQTSPADGRTNSVASPAQEMQSPTSVDSLSPNYGEVRESEPRRCSEVKMMNLQCMSEHIQDMTTYSAGQDIDVSLDSTCEKAAAQQPATSKADGSAMRPEDPAACVLDAPMIVEHAGAGAEQAEADLQHMADMEIQGGEIAEQYALATEDITNSTHLSPNSQQVVGQTGALPGSFAVDVSLDEPALMTKADAVMSDIGATISAGSPAASESPKRIRSHAVHDSFSFGGPAKKAAVTPAEEQVVASLAQLPFGGLASHAQPHAALDAGNHAAQADFEPPEISEEPTSFANLPGSRSLAESNNFVSVSLADGCGVRAKPIIEMQPASGPDGYGVEAQQVDDMQPTASDPDAEVVQAVPEGNATTTVSNKADKPLGPAPALPPRHPSPPPAANDSNVPNLTLKPGFPPAKDIGIREAVEQAVQSSPTARQRQISPGGVRLGVGRCGDSIPLFIKDLPGENLLDDTGMEEWLSPSKEPAKNFNGLMETATAAGEGTDIDKIFESLRALEATVPAAAQNQDTQDDEGALQSFTNDVQQSPSQQKEVETSKARQMASPQPSLVKPSSAQKSPAVASANKQPAASFMKSPRNSAIAPNKSPRGVPTASAKPLKSQASSQAHSLRSPRGLPTAAPASTTSTMKSPRKTLLNSSGSKSSLPAANKTTAAPKSARGTGITSLVPKTTSGGAGQTLPSKTPRGTSISSLAQKTANGGAGQTLPSKTPRGTVVSSIPRVSQLSSHLPSAPASTPRGTATSLPSARGTGLSRLAAPKATPRGTLPSAPGKTPRELPSASGAGSNKPNLIAANRSPAKAKDPEPAAARTTTPPRQVSLKRPLSSPVSAHRLRTGRPQPVTPRMEKPTDVDMEDFNPAEAELATETEPVRTQPATSKSTKAAIPLLNLKQLAAPTESKQQEMDNTADDMETCSGVDHPVETKAVATTDGGSAAVHDTVRTPAAGNGALQVNATSIEAWTPELYSTTPAAITATDGKGLAVYDANLQATPFQMLPNVRLDAAVNAPLIDSSPMCWDEDFDNDTQRIIMQLATSPAPAHLGATNDSAAAEVKDPQHSPAPNSIMHMQVQMLLQQVSEYKAQVQQLKSDNMALKDQISTMQFGKDFGKDGDDFEKEARLYAEAELQKIQTQNTQLAGKVQSLEQEQRGAQNEAAELQKSVRQLAETNNMLESERNKAQDQVGMMEEEVTALRSALSSVQQKLTAEQNQVVELNATLAKERDERVKLIKENHDSKKQLKKVVEQLTEAQTEHRMATAEVEKANVLVSKLRQEKDAEVVKNAKLMSDLEKKKAEANELMVMCNELLALQEAPGNARAK